MTKNRLIFSFLIPFIFFSLFLTVFAGNSLAGTVAGAVYDELGNSDLFDEAEIQAFTGNSSDCSYAYVASAEVNASGNYSFSGLADGSYYFQARNSTTHMEEWHISTTAPYSSTNCNNATAVAVNSSSNLTNINFDLAQKALITGSVVDNGGNPIVGINVQASTPGCDWSESFGDETDSNGDYSITVAVGPQYKVGTCGDCSAPAITGWIDEFWDGVSGTGTQDCNNTDLVQPTAGTPSENIDFQLEPAAIISGNISGLGGQLICVNAKKLWSGGSNGCDTDWAGGTQVDASGNFSFTVPVGTYYLDTWAECAPGNPNNIMDESWTTDGVGTGDCNQADSFSTNDATYPTKNIALSEGAVISGTVLDDSTPPQPVQNFHMVASNPGCNQQYHYDADTNDTGDYKIIVPSGDDFQVEACRNCTNNPPDLLGEYWDGASGTGTQDCNLTETVTPVIGTPADNINFTLSPGVTISGNVVDANGNPIENLQIETMPPSCEWARPFSTYTNSTGDYTLLVPATDYKVRTCVSCGNNQAGNWVDEFWDGGTGTTDCSQAGTLSPSASAPEAGINFQLAEGAIISGNVGGLGGEKVCVSAFVPRNGGQNGCDTSYQSGADTESNGNFSFTVPPGSYYLDAGPCGNNNSYFVLEYWTADETGTNDCAQAEQFQVGVGNNPAKNFNVAKGGKVSGFVYEPDGSTPLADENWVRVDAYSGNPCDYNFIGGGDVNFSDGSYITSPIVTGEDVYLKINHAGNHLNVWLTDSGVSDDCNDASPITVALSTTTSGKNFSVPKDSDGDGLSDADETNTYHTNPALKDSDGDGIDDGTEVQIWFNNYNGDIDGDGTLDIADTDADGDGVSDLQEIARGTDLKNDSSTPPALTLYDDFSSGSLDPSKWEPEQYSREVDSGHLQLMVDAPFKKRITAETTPTSVQNSKTKFTLNELSINNGGSAFFNLNGLYYHENSDTSTVTGLVYASIYLGDSGNGLEAKYYIGHFINDEWDIAEIASGAVVAPGNPALAIGSQYQLEIKYNGTNGFVFTMYNGPGSTVLGTASATGPAYGAAITNSRGLKVQTEDKGGRVSVSVDSLETGNGSAAYTVYDDFSGPHLDSSHWAYPEITKEIVGGKLKLLAHSYGDKRTTRSKTRERFNYIETKVFLDGTKKLTSATSRNRVRLDGFLYNDSHGPGSGQSYNGYEGNVWGQIKIDYTVADGLEVVASAEKTLDATDTSWENLFWQKLELPFTLAFDKEYILFIGFAGDYIVTGIYSPTDNQYASGSALINTPKYLPYNPMFELATRVYGNGNDALQFAYFDDVKVSGDPLEKAGDVNVDGTVDLADAILSLQAVSGYGGTDTWAAGDINYDRVIGLPEAIGVMNEVATP